MSKVVFDNIVVPGDRIKILVLREDGSIEQDESVTSDVYGNAILILTEDS